MSEMDDNLPILVIKKKKRGHGGHHGGAWKVAYADFVTAMMALFMVLWIVGQSKQVREYVAQYFRDPGAFHENSKGGGAFDNQAIITGEKLKEDLLKRQEEKLKQMGSQIMSELKKEPKLENLSKQIKIEIVKEGLRIELLETSDAFFFDIGTANLKPDASEILGIIGHEVGRLPNHVILEGHTDSRPYSHVDGYTNFELSADRANAARRVLLVNGLRVQQVDEVRGYADKRLRNALDPFDASNRRISIIIKFEGTDANG